MKDPSNFPVPQVPLEDNFDDVINKARRGLGIADEELCRQSGVSSEDLRAVAGGEVREDAVRLLAGPLGLDRDALVAHARREWYPTQPAFPDGFAMFNTAYGGMTVNSYLLWDPASRRAAAFDTGASVDGMLAVIRARSLDVTHVFLTHTHEDHVADLPRLVRETEAMVLSSEREPAEWDGARAFGEGARFNIGSLELTTRFTWGHSPGQTTFVVAGLALPLAVVGDAIFSSSMGGSVSHYRDQLKNNLDKILTLQPETVIAPGHGPLTTVGQEKVHNPFFAGR